MSNLLYMDPPIGNPKSALDCRWLLLKAVLLIISLTREFNTLSMAQEHLSSRKSDVILLQKYPVDLVLMNLEAQELRSSLPVLASGIQVEDLQHLHQWWKAL